MVALLMLLQAKATTCQCDFTFSSEKRSRQFVDGSKLGIKPGNVICFSAGTYSYIRLINLQGTREKPIIIKNCGGKVKIDVAKSRNHGIVLNNVTNVKLTGSGTGELLYGFEIAGDERNPGRTGVAAGFKVSDLEVEYVEIHDLGLGLHLVNLPTCDSSTWKENWVTENISIHHLNVYRTAKEGLYIGSSKYGLGHEVQCDETKRLLEPPLMKNVKVYENAIDRTGWDSFQVSTVVEDCQIYNNRCTNFGLEDKPAQRAGIVLGGGSTGWIFNNWIANGKGDAIDIFGIGNIRIFNNVISDARRQGIFIGNRALFDDDYSFLILHNTIIRSGEDGIRYNNQFSKSVEIKNNLISESGSKAINILKKSKSGVQMASNLDWDSESELLFDTNKEQYAVPAQNSELVDHGVISSYDWLAYDFLGTRRANIPDIGAIEYAPIPKHSLVYVGHALSYEVESNTSFKIDLPSHLFKHSSGRSLIFELTAKNSGIGQMDWLLFNEKTNQLIGKPATKDVGSFGFEYTASDTNGLNASTTVILSIVAPKVVQTTVMEVPKEQAESIQENTATSLDKITREDIKVYPSVVTKYMLVETKADPMLDLEFTILDQVENVVLKEKLRNGKAWVDMREIPQGSYIVRFIVGTENIDHLVEKR